MVKVWLISKYANLSQAEVDIFNKWYNAGYPNGPSLPKIAFTNTIIKNIFDNKCNKCHGPNASDASKWTYDITDYNNSIKAKISNIYGVINSLTAKMAVASYGNLTQIEIDNITAWYKNGYLNN